MEQSMFAQLRKSATVTGRPKKNGLCYSSGEDAEFPGMVYFTKP
jgi:hypothetical protein